MNRVNYKNAKLISRALYFLEGIVLLCRYGLFENHNTTWLLAFFGVWLFSLAILMVFNEDGIIAENAYCMYVFICSSGLMIFDVYQLNDVLLTWLVFSVQWLAILTFMKKHLCIFIACVQALILMLFKFWELFGRAAIMSISDYIASLCVIFVMCWIAVNLILFIERQNKKSIEQERSLDDMLYIVETMCDRATRAAKIKADFLSNMSHEIRTPINSVLGMNEMIARESTEENILEYSAGIASSGNMLLSIINDILDFSKIESGKMEIIPVEYQLSSIVSDLVHMIQGRMDEKNLKFEIQIDESLPEKLLGDEVRIKQILTNLLTNAVKYTDQGSVTLKMCADEAFENHPFSLRVDIIDTGKGIKEEDRDVLFSAFTRVDEKVNRTIEGTGLGLAITSNFVDMMEGKIGLNSEYGKGSDFYVIIPQTVISTEPIGNINDRMKNVGIKEVPRDRIFTAKDASVLIVDDNTMNIKVETLLLKQTKMKVTTATSGQEAIEILKKQTFDIIFLDHMMPIMDGLETLAEMKKQKLVMNVPVVALTANAIIGAKEMYLEHGFCDYLTKPIVIQDLEALLERTLPKEMITWENRDVDAKQPDEAQVEEQKAVKEAVDNNYHETTDSCNATDYIDEKVALTYAGGDEATKQFMWEVYLEEAGNNQTVLQKAFDEKDWKQYQVKVHSLKSTSLGVGAVQLSEKAKTIELALKAGDTSAALEGHQELMVLFQKVVKAMQELL